MQPLSAVAAGKKKRIDAAINGTGKIWRGNGSLKQGTFLFKKTFLTNVNFSVGENFY